MNSPSAQPNDLHQGRAHLEPAGEEPEDGKYRRKDFGIGQPDDEQKRPNPAEGRCCDDCPYPQRTECPMRCVLNLEASLAKERERREALEAAQGSVRAGVEEELLGLTHRAEKAEAERNRWERTAQDYNRLRLRAEAELAEEREKQENTRKHDRALEKDLLSDRDRYKAALERIAHGKPQKVRPGDERHLEIPYEARTLSAIARSTLSEIPDAGKQE